MSAILKPLDTYTQADVDLEVAHDAMTRYAVAMGNSDAAAHAWALCHAIKDMRRAEVVEAMEAEKLERVAAG